MQTEKISYPIWLTTWHINSGGFIKVAKNIVAKGHTAEAIKANQTYLNRALKALHITNKSLKITVLKVELVRQIGDSSIKD